MLHASALSQAIFRDVDTNNYLKKDKLNKM